MAPAIIKDSDFHLVKAFVRPDARQRLVLGEALAGGTAFTIYRNALGQLLLDPVTSIPAAEAWLFARPATLARVKQGLRESTQGKTVFRGSFARRAK